MLNEHTRFKIPFEDDKLLDYDNKKYKIYPNGHPTYPREYILKEAIKAGLVNKENNPTEMRCVQDAWERCSNAGLSLMI